MPLEPGTTFGNYEISAPIGAGGMGEVYRAKDTKLGRDVAIKVLPEELSRDQERLNRFEREAKLLAQLNHANIATIHGLEEFDGQPLLVMELVEGETLADRIARGPLPVEETIPIFTQIAEGLEAAHDKGIIHRDLKPANVKITPEGQVKILDFGLAKAFHDEVERADDSSQSPTLTRGTALGVILGTASYMSPEQARGKAVDKRTDLWAFGCCLYEALTGRKAFVGETTTDTLAAIVNREPKWDELPEPTPTSVRRLLRRCLTKNMRGRLTDAGMARIELTELSSGEETTPAARANAWRRPLALFVTGVAIAGLLGTLFSSFHEPERSQVRRVAITPPTGHRIDVSPLWSDIDISADGERIAFIALNADDGERELYLRAIDDFRVRPIDTMGASPWDPRFSPDSQWLAFYDATESRILRVPIAGGRPETLCETSGYLRFSGFDWASDGSVVVSTRTGSLWRCHGGRAAEQITTVDSESGEIMHVSPQVLPGRSAILFTVLTGAIQGELAVHPGGNGTHRRLGVAGVGPRYVRTGHIVYGREGSLRAVPFDLDSLEVTGESFPVLTNVTTKQESADFDVADDGSLVYVPGGHVLRDFGRRTLAWVDREGRIEPLAAQPSSYTRLQISPSGDRVALEVREGTADVWVWDLSRETLTRVTFDPAIDGFPVWISNDTLLFESHRVAQGNVYEKSADGTGVARRVVESPNHHVPVASSPDGKSFVLREQAAWGDDDLLLVSRETGAPEPLLATEFNEDVAAVSPDGRWIAYQSDESGSDEIYVRPFSNVDDGRWKVSSTGGAHPVWSKDGRELFFLDDENHLSVAEIRTTDGNFAAGRPERILGHITWTSRSGQVYDVSPDGNRFLMILEEPAGAGAPTEIHLVLNWLDELERLAEEAE